ncbi:hypothetical protein CONLIGDRAFT_147201 [Coniochaeta ligniaria NRRL 30616]|uniref:Uncharacterized protein n=1 Tax=Coniochaeta ligniaria NRRL 30616 TaxID=1408157 RepID=A0A1J7J6D0_9PEZI|nr:hypothetical protein CONLIGDRAFT_147201 [Coniochaeta ligniaria NRRL 30616]
MAQQAGMAGGPARFRPHDMYSRYEVLCHAKQMFSFTEDNTPSPLVEAQAHANRPRQAEKVEDVQAEGLQSGSDKRASLGPLAMKISENPRDKILRSLVLPRGLFWIKGPVDSKVPLLVASSICQQQCGGATTPLRTRIECVELAAPRRHPSSSSSGLTEKKAGLVNFLYSLTYKLVNVLPDVFHACLGLGVEDFKKLDGSMASVEPALEMIRLLLSIRQPLPDSDLPTAAPLICAIDGIQALEDQETIPHIETLVDILREQSAKADVIVLFTTDGVSVALASKLKAGERIHM